MAYQFMALKKFCRKQGCKELTDEGYCLEHQKESTSYDQYRESAAKRGYGAKWKKARLQHLAKHPLCVDCLDNGKIKQATDVDHITPHKGDMKIFWDRSNWQSLCKACHSRKTVKEDGGFGGQTKRSGR